MRQKQAGALSKKGNDQRSDTSSVAIGEGKGEPILQARWLQDVFSDSANLEGMQQKTSRHSKMNGRKEAQLQKKETVGR